MTLQILLKRMNRRSSKTTSLSLRFYHPILVELLNWTIWLIFIGEILVKLRMSMYTILHWHKSSSPTLSPFDSLDLSFSFSSSICWTWRINLEIYTYLINMLVRHSLTILSDTSDTNLFILHLELTTIVRAYFKNWMNFNKYSLNTHVPLPYIDKILQFIFPYLNGKETIINPPPPLNLYEPKGPASNVFFSFHWSNQT